jgi:hypothetical protein
MDAGWPAVEAELDDISSILPRIIFAILIAE